MKKFFLGTNTKMYKTIKQTQDYLTNLISLTQDIDPSIAELFVIPSFTALETAGKICQKGKIHLGAQNMCWEDEGQYTGEISPLMLKEVGAEIVEIGHSERRSIMCETDEMINQKILCALRHELTPLLCVGETYWQKQHGIAEEVIRLQIKLALYNVMLSDKVSLMIAYEPMWAIGVNGQSSSVEYAEYMLQIIRDELKQIFGEATSDCIPVLYGGSVNSGNACGFAAIKELNGLFIGRAAWESENFNRIIRDTLEVRQNLRS